MSLNLLEVCVEGVGGGGVVFWELSQSRHKSSIWGDISY